MANSIKDGIINYSSVKYKIIGETDTYYIGFGIRDMRSVICRINKDLTGWKSKSITTPMLLTKAIVNPDGSIIAIGNFSTRESIDYDCPGSYRVYNEGIICRYKSDLSIIDPEVELYPFIVYSKSSSQLYSDIYFKDIVKIGDSYIVIGHGINKTENKIEDIVGKFSWSDYTGMTLVPNRVKNVIPDFQAKAVADSLITDGQLITIISRLENITQGIKTYLYGIKLTAIYADTDILSIGTTYVIFGAKLLSFCFDDNFIFILGAYQETLRSGSVVMHGKIQNKLYKVDRKDLSVEALILPEAYDKISIQENVLVLEINYADPETASILRLTKDLLLHQ